MDKLTMAQRNCLIVLALFPTLWGLLALLNNVTGFAGVVKNAVYPMISMARTYQNPAQIWRAVDSMELAAFSLVIITAVEALAGFLGLYALIKMLKNRKASYDAFCDGKVCLMYACLTAIAVWGIGFIVMGGDWFLAWQNKDNPLGIQLSAFIYCVPNFLTLIACFIHKENQ